MLRTDGKRMIPILSILVSMLILEPLSYHTLIRVFLSQDIGEAQNNRWGSFLESYEKDWMVNKALDKKDRVSEDNKNFHMMSDKLIILKMILYLDIGIVIFLFKTYKSKNKDTASAIPLGGHAPPIY